MIYDTADKAIKQMNRLNLRAFNRLKLAKWDELSVIRVINSIYSESAREARKRYLEIAREAYMTALIETGMSRTDAAAKARKRIDDDWILDMLEEIDPVTLYIFMTEMDRKKQRLVEAIDAAQDKGQEVDKALRYWTVQVGQYADNAVFEARVQAFRDAGIEFVRWVTQHDERVCKTCDERDGQIYRIDNIPRRHPRCRCLIFGRVI